jgi:YVTN family beta-propeller protein
MATKGGGWWRMPMAISVAIGCGRSDVVQQSRPAFEVRRGDANPSTTDSEFVARMIPHHQVAIEMARSVLANGHNDRLRRLAQEMLVTQQAEIAAMRLALDSAPAPPDVDRTPATRGSPSHDRVYAAEQFSNTVSVIDPGDNTLLGVIRLGDPLPGSLSPLYRGQLLVHGLGFSPDHRTLAVVSIGSNSVAFIDTKTNVVKHVTYVGRSPHEAFFTPDGREVWVTVRGENYVSVLDGLTYDERSRIEVPNGPGMQIFSPDGKYGYVCSSFTPKTVVVSVAEHKIVGEVPQDSPFCPNIAVTPDGSRVWFTLKDVGRTVVFDGRPPFSILKRIDTGPITNHVNIVRNGNGTFAFVTVGGLNEVQVFRASDFTKVTTIPVGRLPHGIWPSDDGTRVYVGLENEDRMVEIDALSYRVLSTIPIGEAAQAIAYVSNAVPDGDGLQGLQPLGNAALTTQLWLAAPSADAGRDTTRAPTSVTLFEQGIQQVLQAAVTGLHPGQAYVLALAKQRDGGGSLEPLQPFTTNPAGAAIVNAIGPIRQTVRASTASERRFLVICSGTPARLGPVVQVQRR